MIRTAWFRTPTDKALFYAGIGVFLIIAVWATCFIPMNNDEATPYRILGWMTHPFSSYQYQGGGRPFNLTTSFGLMMCRSFSYAGGIVSSFLYSPVYLLWHSPAAQYGYSALLFLLFAGLTARLTERPIITFMLIASFFPFVFDFIHDLGPIKLGFLAFPIGAWLYRKAWETETHLAVFHALLIAALLCAAIEDKIFFLASLLPFFLFCIAFQPGLERRSFDRPRFLLIWSIIGAVVFCWLLILLLSHSEKGHFYATDLMLISQAQAREMGENSLVLDFSKNGVVGGGKWFVFLLFWPYYAHRYVDLALGDSAGSIVLFCGFAAATGLWLCACAGLCFQALRQKERARLITGRGFWLAASCLAMALCLFALGGVWAGHHFVFLWLPLIVLLAHVIGGLGEKQGFVLIAAFMLINLASLLAVTQQPFLREAAPEKQAVMDYFAAENRAEHAVIAYMQWGNNYIHELYGPANQIVTAIAKKDSFVKDYALAQRLNRQLYVVCRTQFDMLWEQLTLAGQCSKKGLEAGALKLTGEPLTASDMLPGLQIWHVYSLSGEKQPVNPQGINTPLPAPPRTVSPDPRTL